MKGGSTMNHAFNRFITCALMLACLVPSGAAVAGIKLQFIERPTPHKLHQPPGFHTNQGGRSAGGDEFIKPRGEMTIETLEELLIPQAESILPLLQGYGTPAAAFIEPDTTPGMKRSIVLKPFSSIEGFEPDEKWATAIQPPPRNAPLVPAPGALVLLLGGTFGLTRRRRRS
jgi:hypothetical protein